MSSSMATSPCVLCNNFPPPTSWIDILMLKFTPRALVDAVKAGCPMCKLVLDGLVHFKPKFGPIADLEELRLENYNHTFEISGYSKNEVLKMRFAFFTTPADNTLDDLQPLPLSLEPLYSRLVSQPTISGDTASESAFEWASRTLRNCINSHKKCKLDRNTKLPTRVLDVGASQQSSLENAIEVKLVQSSGFSAQYACLSHCWGTSKQITTTSKNMDAHMKGIAWESLPKTFHDAIVFTRRLRLRYLWIDSLCIIQDDKNDWAKESAQMAAIYQNSYITLVATKSGNGSGGCFSSATPMDQDHPLTPPFVESIAGEEKSITRSRIFVREQLVHFNDINTTEHPLISRGWVYQERLLAPRVLHFCAKELVWECQEGVDCECNNYDSAPMKELEKFKVAEMLEDWALPKRRHQTRRPVTLLWHQMVQRYSRLALTKRSDKLPAIAGLAREIGRCKPGKYLAGLWEDSLYDDLLWEADDKCAERLGSYRAPSWSWASVNGSVRFSLPGEGTISDGFLVLGAICTPIREGDDYGELREAHLDIKAQLTPAKIVYGPKLALHDDTTTVGHQGEHTFLDFDGVSLRSLETDYCLMRKGTDTSPTGK
ncbi:HET-domain-containing protein [Lophium mytilinum]|uniref:HET-domain-containing protein n=1 Tax=Lophium mytilinum TaxID=390894 RepID=A0A6A6R211_9PEZI|nr:HET-domain-containing protein [Lophium mytilinum]